MGRKHGARLFMSLVVPVAALLLVLVLFGNAPSTSQASTGVMGPDDSGCSVAASVLGTDSDGDTVPDGSDNCPSTYNPGQLDTDGDGLGDVCDPDDDNDTVLDVNDNCPKTKNANQADMDGDGRGDACDQDADGDGYSNQTEWLYGSDPWNATKTPEHIMVPGTCSDGVDNDKDGSTDAADPGCNPQPIFDGHLEIHIITNLKTTADVHVVMPPMPPTSCTLTGDTSVMTTATREYAPGQYEIDTEIVSMDLSGHCPPLGGDVHVKSRGDPSTGKIIDLNPLPAQDFPAESFFDVYFTIGGGGGGYHTEEEMELTATAPIHQLPPPAADYEENSPSPVYLYNEDGEIVGDTGPGACPANCATIETTNLHTAGADKAVTDLRLDDASAYPDEGAPLQETVPGEWVYNKLYYKSQNVKVSVTSEDTNNGPDVPADSRITFLADVPKGCEGRWVTDPLWPHDILTTGGTVNPQNAMDQVDGQPVPPGSPKVPGDGDPTTIESDLHFQTLEYSISEPVATPRDLLRFFEFHCFYDARDGFDDDNDGWIDEDPVDGIDNDQDGKTDEDPPGFVFTFYNKIEPKETPDPNLANNWQKATMMVNSLPNGDVDIVNWRAPLVVITRVNEPTYVWVSEAKHNAGPQDIVSQARWTAAPSGPITATWVDSGTPMLQFPVTLPMSSDIVVERQLRIQGPSPGGPYEVMLINNESMGFSDPVTGVPMWDPDLGNNVETTTIDVYVLGPTAPSADKQATNVRLDDGSGFPSQGNPLMLLGSNPPTRTTNWEYGLLPPGELQYLKSQNVKVSVISYDQNMGPMPVTDAYVSFLADVPQNCEGRWIPQGNDMLTAGGWVNLANPMDQLEGRVLVPSDPDYLRKMPGDGDPATIESDLHFQTSELENPGSMLNILRFFEFHCWQDGDYTFTFYNKIEPKTAQDPNMANNWWKATMLVHSLPNADVDIVSWTAPNPINAVVGEPLVIPVEEEKHNLGPQDTESFARWTASVNGPFNLRWIAQPGDTCTLGGVQVACSAPRIDDLEFWVNLPVSNIVPLERQLELTCPVAGPFMLTLTNDESIELRDPDPPHDPMEDPNWMNNTEVINIPVNCLATAPQANKVVNDVRLDDGSGYPAEGPELNFLGTNPATRTTDWAYNLQYLLSHNVKVSVKSLDMNLGPDIPPDSYVSFLADIPPGCMGRWIPQISPSGVADNLTQGGTVNPSYPIEQVDGQSVPPSSPKVPGDGNPTTIESDLHFQTADWSIEELPGLQTPLLRFFEFDCWVEGPHIFTFYNKIEPKDPVDDPDLSNNWWKATMSVFVTPNADKMVESLVVEGADEIAPDVYKLDVLKDQNVPVDLTSLDINLGPLPPPPPDSYVSFLADIPPECEGRWADDPARQYDTHTTNGWIDLGNPMDQIAGDIVEPPIPKVPGDGNPATIESDLHFQTAPYEIVETIGLPIPLTRTFEIHCFEDGAFTFTFYNKIEPGAGYVDPNPGNNWKRVELIVNSLPSADVEVVSWTAPDTVYGTVGQPLPVIVHEEKHNWGPDDTESFASWTAIPAGQFTAVWADSGTGTLQWWVPLVVSNVVLLDKQLNITCQAPIPQPGMPLTLTNDESIAFRDPVTHEPMQDPNLANNVASRQVMVVCQAGLPTDKQVVDLAFDDGWRYPLEGSALHINPTAPFVPVFFLPPGVNWPVSVKSVEYNPGPGVPANALVNFYADIPAGCMGRWKIDPAVNPVDIPTTMGDPYAPPFSPQQLGIELPPGYPKIEGGQPGFESDLHFYTADYQITEPVGQKVEIRRFFEVMCYVPGQFMFTFCNKIEAVGVDDPNYNNNYRCEQIWVDTRMMDQDGDGGPDFLDNCPFTPNPGQQDVDGDGYGDVCDNCPATANLDQKDYDNDGVPGLQPGPTDNFGGDVCDNDGDNDSKGAGPAPGFFRDSRELFMGTDPLDECADTATSNDERGPAFGEPLSPWPPDFNDSGKVTSGDLVLFKQHYMNPAMYNVRYDLNASGGPTITSADLVIFKSYYIGSGRDTCTVSMP
jgi:hypothetical protein